MEEVLRIRVFGRLSKERILILITGASSAIGQRFSAMCRASDLKVEPLRSADGSVYRFGDKPDLDQVANAVTLIHIAWSRDSSTDKSQSVNLQVIDLLTDVAQSASCRFVFLSSLAASPRSTSHYGKEKFSAEQVVLDSGGVCVRSGLIWDDIPTAAFKQLVLVLRFLPFSLSVLGHQPAVQLVHADDLCRVLISLCTDTSRNSPQCNSNLITIAHPRSIKLEELFIHVGRKPPRVILPIGKGSLKFARILMSFSNTTRVKWEQIENFIFNTPDTSISNQFQLRDFP